MFIRGYEMNTKQTIQMLREYESRNVLFAEADGSWPIVWEKAKGASMSGMRTGKNIWT